VQDAEIELLERAIASHARTLQLTRNQYAVGVVARANVVQAQARWQATQAQAHDAHATRAQLEHAVAVLVGRAPAEFALEAAPLELQAPEIPAGLPAQLLERRADVAGAERRVAAASARIGVAKASAYPSLGVFAGVTIRRGPVGGAKLEVPLYAGELPESVDTRASAAYDEAVANYRQAALGALREVEDSLVAIDRLEQAAAAQAQAAAAARQAESIADNQYRAGISSYLAVAVVQAAALDNERADLALRGRRLVASVQLVKALGGGWQPEPAPAGPTAGPPAR
jgi:NodT family efflux transporter outer membrane factor (OMF) lipoprotein